MHIDSVYFGYEFEEATKILTEEDGQMWKFDAKPFLWRCVNSLGKNYLQKHHKERNIVPIVSSFMRFSIDDCQNEWENIPNKQREETSDVVKFWAEVYRDKDSANNQRLKNISHINIS